jgi:hypothetical protein
MKSADAPKMPYWQFGTGLCGVGQRRSFGYEALQQRVDGNA